MQNWTTFLYHVELFQVLKYDAVKLMYSYAINMPANLENSKVLWPQDWKRSVFIPIPKKGNDKEFSNYHTIALISHTSKVMLKILQAGFNSMWTVNFLMFKLVLEKAEEPRSSCQHLLDHRKSMRVPEKRLLLLYWLCQSLWLCGSQQTVENS